VKVSDNGERGKTVGAVEAVERLGGEFNKIGTVADAIIHLKTPAIEVEETGATIPALRSSGYLSGGTGWESVIRANLAYKHLRQMVSFGLPEDATR